MNRLNYGEYIFQQLLMTKFVQDKLTIILMSIFVNIVQMHIVSILCVLLSFGPIIDFVLHTFISIIVTLNMHLIYNAVERYKSEFNSLTRYLINNYSFENYRYWKRIVVGVASGYACIILWRTEVTSWLLFIYIIQSGICFSIVDQIEERRLQTWLQEWLSQPTIKNHDPMTNKLIESYMSPSTKLLHPNFHSIVTPHQLDRPSFNQGLVKPVNKSLHQSRILKRKTE